MDINNLQRTLPQLYHVDACRIKERLQQAHKNKEGFLLALACILSLTECGMAASAGLPGVSAY